MSKLDIFRAIPRPLGQYLAIGLIWPLWVVLGWVEVFWPGTGAVVQDAVKNGLASIPEAGWAAIAAIIVAHQWSRSKDKETERDVATAWAEGEKARAGGSEAI